MAGAWGEEENKKGDSDQGGNVGKSIRQSGGLRHACCGSNHSRVRSTSVPHILGSLFGKTTNEKK